MIIKNGDIVMIRRGSDAGAIGTAVRFNSAEQIGAVDALKKNTWEVVFSRQKRAVNTMTHAPVFAYKICIPVLNLVKICDLRSSYADTGEFITKPSIFNFLLKYVPKK